MDILMLVPLIGCFVAGGFCVVIGSSPINKLRLAAWLEARARAQEEMMAARRAIQDEARLYQRRREVQLMRPKDGRQDQERGELVQLARG